MSYVIAVPALMDSAATDLATIRSNGQRAAVSTSPRSRLPVVDKGNRKTMPPNWVRRRLKL
jgi:hypothetical protein